jgi:hypothetical protein
MKLRRKPKGNRVGLPLQQNDKDAIEAETV